MVTLFILLLICLCKSVFPWYISLSKEKLGEFVSNKDNFDKTITRSSSNQIFYISKHSKEVENPKKWLTIIKSPPHLGIFIEFGNILFDHGMNDANVVKIKFEYIFDFIRIL